MVHGPTLALFLVNGMCAHRILPSSLEKRTSRSWRENTARAAWLAPIERRVSRGENTFKVTQIVRYHEASQLDQASVPDLDTKDLADDFFRMAVAQHGPQQARH